MQLIGAQVSIRPGRRAGRCGAGWQPGPWRRDVEVVPGPRSWAHAVRGPATPKFAVPGVPPVWSISGGLRSRCSAFAGRNHGCQSTYFISAADRARLRPRIEVQMYNAIFGRSIGPVFARQSIDVSSRAHRVPALRPVGEDRGDRGLGLRAERGGHQDTGVPVNAGSRFGPRHARPRPGCLRSESPARGRSRHDHARLRQWTWGWGSATS